MNVRCVGRKTESSRMRILEQSHLPVEASEDLAHGGGGCQTTEAEEIQRERSGGRQATLGDFIVTMGR
mgnify:CR=1 FL=1